MIVGPTDLDSRNECPPLVEVLLWKHDLIECRKGDFFGVLFALDHIVKVHLVEFHVPELRFCDGVPGNIVIRNMVWNSADHKV